MTRSEAKDMMTEKQLTNTIAEYLQAKKILYRFDLAADTRLSIGQATRNKKLHSIRGYPDLVILATRGGYGALFIELKKASSEVFKKDGEFKKSAHLKEQRLYHEKLEEAGYKVEWGLGYKDTVNKIEKYLKQKDK